MDTSQAPGSETLFLDFLARRDAGEALDIESVIRVHPKRAAELRAHYENWRTFGPLLEAAVPLRGDSGALGALEPSSLTHSSGAPREPVTLEMVRGLQQALVAQQRYAYHSLIGRGGMGAVLAVRDRQLNRLLAMKVVLGREDAHVLEREDLDAQRMARFIAEAQITGQLDHPGIVPVHEVGFSPEQRAWFTMRLVRGEDFASIVERVRVGDPNWTLVRALQALLRACEAVAYAHSRGVVHRDLKPANLMVGRFGEVYVMDWGLARVLARPGESPDADAPQTVRSHAGETDPRSPLVSRDGEVLGSPCYMPPEQARGDLEKVSFAADVYALGAVLSRLLSGSAPFEDQGPWPDARAMIAHIASRTPTPIEQLEPSAPAELIAIAERALERQPAQRYPSVEAFAADLRAFLENRVVSAHARGTWAETRKWVARNRSLAAALAGALAILVAGLASVASYAGVVEAKSIQLDQVNRSLERDRYAYVSSRQSQLLTRAAAALWPAHPELIDEYEQWLAQTRALLAGARDTDTGAVLRDGLTEFRVWRDSLPVEASGPEHTLKETPRELLDELVADLEGLVDPHTGLAENCTAEAFGWGIERRLAFARELDVRSLHDVEARRTWDEAREAILTSPHYGGLRLCVQTGLLPLGPDPHSGLWEFAHLMSGAPPERGADGRWEMRAETCIVLVLVPGGRFTMGAQQFSEDELFFDEEAHPDECPPHEVELSPYFLSKYEMHQGPWRRITGHNPSSNGVEYESSCARCDERNPVEQVSWFDCVEALRRYGLTLPSEAQWERACRAGSNWVFVDGPTQLALVGAANIADAAVLRTGLPWQQAKEWPDNDDGWCFHAPVGTFRPNAFGFHDMLGNVFEWCADRYEKNYYAFSPALDPHNPVVAGCKGVHRGGSMFNAARVTRPSYRLEADLRDVIFNCGVRPARSLER